MTSVGIFLEHHADVDVFWEQCDEPYGRHRGLELRGGDAQADHILVVGLPLQPGPRVRLQPVDRVKGALRGDSGRRKLIAAWERLALPRERTSVLFYEPSPHVKDSYYEIARRYAKRVYGTDERADEQVTLGSRWLVEGQLHELRAAPPPAKTVPLAVVSSGKNVLPGHGPRLSFFQKLRAAGVPLEAFGRGLPEPVGSRGSVRSKRGVLEPARFALALENHVESPYYITEKLWDALLAWCLPFYYGHGAVDALIPSDAYIRLPDLGDAGVAVVQEALAAPELWDQRREAMAEARRRVLGEHRMVEWIRRTIVGLPDAT
ncbi:MAG: glycosyltransferase family 10 [Planctomycetota bacterium]|nr:glycosyltransferase family 10 [Planctomycetota bacterium]